MIGRRSRERWYDSKEPPTLSWEEVLALDVFLGRMRELANQLRPPGPVEHPHGIVPPSQPPESE